MSTIKVDTVRPVTTDGSLTLQGDSSGSGVSGITIDSSGNATLGGNLVIPNSGTIGSESATGAITIDASGNTTLGGNLVIPDSGTIGSTSATGAIIIDSNGTAFFGGGYAPSSSTKITFYATPTAAGLATQNSTTGATNKVATFRSNAATEIGHITCSNTTTSFSSSSDYRLKENITPLTGAIDRLNQLKPSRFNFISDPDTTFDGFLAHEVSNFVPEAVTGEKDAVDENGDIEPQGIDQSKLVPLLTAALQEAVSKIEALTARIKVLENAAG